MLGMDPFARLLRMEQLLLLLPKQVQFCRFDKPLMQTPAQ